MHLIVDHCSDSSGKPYKNRYPNKWVIIEMLSTIILVFILVIILYIIFRQ